MRWCRTVSIPVVSVYMNGSLSLWGSHDISGSGIDELLTLSANTQLSKDNIHDLVPGHETKHPYPDLLISLGRSPYMPMCGVPPTLLTYSEI
jgi:hypothetical protein